MTDSWTKKIKPSDFTAYMELMSLLDFADAWLCAYSRPSSSSEPIRALSRARTLLVHSTPESQTIRRLMRKEWLHSRYARAALTYKHLSTLEEWIPVCEIKKHLLCRPSLGLLLDLDNRLDRSGVMMLEVTEIIADTERYNQQRRDQAERLIQIAESMLNLDFEQMYLRVCAVSEKLIMSDHRRWDYTQSRIKYWDHAFSLQRKLLKLLKDALMLGQSTMHGECLETVYERIAMTSHSITSFELQSASQELSFHFPEIVNKKGIDDVYP